MKIGNVEIYGIIYKIKNQINGKIYIGQTIHGFNRRYKNNLEGYTSNTHLKNSITNYGINNFEISKVIDIAFSQVELDIKEEVWIAFYKSYDERFGYNKTTGGGSVTFTKEVKKKMSQSQKEKWKNKEYRKSFLPKLKAITQSEGYRNNMSQALINSEAHKQACSSDEFRERQKELKLELWQDEEYAEKVLKAINESWDEERREQASEMMKNRYEEEAYMENARQNLIERWNNPIEREKLVNGMKKIFLIVNIETKESLEFLGRKSLAKYIGMSESYVKKRMYERIVYNEKFIFIRKDKMQDKGIIVDGQNWTFKKIPIS